MSGMCGIERAEEYPFADRACPHAAMFVRHYAEGVTEQSPGPAQRRPGLWTCTMVMDPNGVTDVRCGPTNGVTLIGDIHRSIR